MIQFNKAPVTGSELKYVTEAVNGNKMSGGGMFSERCQEWFEKELGCKRTLLTPSCTAALELAAILINIKPGDEVIMPSYTFVSTANAFVMRGASIVFVDIRPDTMNIDEMKIESAITNRTKAIVPVHYAGVSCNMRVIMRIAKKHSLFVIEDAAQGMMSSYEGAALGTIGDIGTYSFHETKNYTSGGEGGLLLINNPELIDRAEIIREKGTNRNKFLRGQVDKYTWVDIGGSYLPGELQAAYLWGQIKFAHQINKYRLKLWDNYFKAFKSLSSNKGFDIFTPPTNVHHNAHMFYLKLSGMDERSKFISFLKDNGVISTFHYVPLHSSPAGKKFGRFHGADVYTTQESERLVRLPMYYGMSDEDQYTVIQHVREYFS